MLRQFPWWANGPYSPNAPVEPFTTRLPSLALTRCTVGGKNSAPPAVFALFAEFRPTSNFGRNFRLLWIFGFFGFFVNFRCFLLILLLNFDVHHSARHLVWGRKGIAPFLSKGCNIVSSYGFTPRIIFPNVNF